MTSLVLFSVASLAAQVRLAEDQRPWMDPADSPELRAALLVKEMTLAEKTHLFHGSCGGYVGNVCANTRLGIPMIKMNDGPQGFRDDGHPGTSTAWPCSLAIAATFDVSASRDWGTAMGDEFYRKGANVQLGPGVCLARVPRNGRNFEYISGEDPYLGHVMVQPAIEGIQREGVVANAKHWVMNNQETDRTEGDMEVDERTRFEMYYPPFEGAIAANVGSFMCSYNKINAQSVPGTGWSCENPETLQRDLKDRLGFKGWVMSDWGATHSMSIVAGLDQEMPGSDFMGDSNVAKAVADGSVPLSRVDDAAKRVLTPLFAVGVFDKNNTNTQENNVTSAAHQALARTLAARSIVLLQNEQSTLPLVAASAPLKVALIGLTAMKPVVAGGGSGYVSASYRPAPYDAILAKMSLVPPPSPPPQPANCSEKQYEAGFDYRNTDDQTAADADSVDQCCTLCATRTSPTICNYFSFQKSPKTCWMKSSNHGRMADDDVISGGCRSSPPTPVPPACNPSGTKCVYYDDGSDAERAARTAAMADVAIVFVSTSSSEGGDRASLSFDGNADELVAKVAASGVARTVVAGVAPGAVLTPWRHSVQAITLGFMPGQEYGNALADVLFGDVNPSAKLPITLPLLENDVNFTQSDWPGTGSGLQRVATYSEKLLVGYRWYDTHGVTPAFPFGHGLSYSTFALTNLQVTRSAGTADPQFSVSVLVENTGSSIGTATPQLYLTFPEAAGEPPFQLKGFKSVVLAPRKLENVTFTLDQRSRSIWDVQTIRWAEVVGTYRVTVGLSSRDPRALKGSFSVA